MAVSNDLLTDQRVERHRRALTEAGYDVVVLGRGDVPTRHGRGWRFYLELNWGLRRRVAAEGPDIVWANDTDTLPGCWWAAHRMRCKLVMDAHELFPEVPEIQHKPFVKWVWRTVERWLMPQCDALLTVSGGIAEHYRLQLGVSMTVVRNLSSLSSLSSLTPGPSPIGEGSGMQGVSTPLSNRRGARGVATLLYQGKVNVGRGVDWAIDALEWLPGCRLVVAGDGDLLEAMKAYAAAKPWSDRISFTGRLMPAELHALTPQADVGLVMLEDMGLSYHYALPNRIGDFVQAGVPMVVSDLPEMRAVVKRYRVGEVIEEANALAVAQAVERVLAREWREADFEAARRDMDWNKEKQLLINIAKALCSTTSL